MAWHFEQEREKLKNNLLALSALVEYKVQRAVEAFTARDDDGAGGVIAEDIDIDLMEVDIEEECLKLLALHQPVASDLRFIIAVLKINNDLERIGDEAVNIAERTCFLARHAPVDVRFDFTAMALKTQNMLRRSLDALVAHDADLARAVGAADDEVDILNRRAYQVIQQAMRRDPERVEQLVHHLSTSRHLERIADYATNIAEEVLYMIEGEIVRHKPEVFQ